MPPAPTDRFHELALWLTPGIGDVTTRHLVAACGSAAAVFSLPPGRLRKIRGIGPATARPILEKVGFALAEAVLRACEACSQQVLFFTDDNYPARLRRLYDAPAVLFWKGEGSLNASRQVGIVGTRKCTDYGRHITEELVEALKPTGAGIVSGMAFGIDITAHRAALRHGLPTFGVLAGGLDQIYPAAHAKTATQLLAAGGLLCEHPPGTPPDPRFFLNRNRIIAGLSDVVVVVESARKGGAMVTAEYAANYHREVFAVPGSLKNPMSAGCNYLISSNKAAIYTQIDDLLSALHWEQGPGAAAAHTDADFTAQESELLAVLRLAPQHIDRLAWHLQFSHAQLAELLLSLEFRGVVRSLPGKMYALG